MTVMIVRSKVILLSPFIIPTTACADRRVAQMKAKINSMLKYVILNEKVNSTPVLID